MWVIDGRTELMAAGKQTLVLTHSCPLNTLYRNVIQQLCGTQSHSSGALAAMRSKCRSSTAAGRRLAFPVLSRPQNQKAVIMSMCNRYSRQNASHHLS
jgi:hypothetical protein